MKQNIETIIIGLFIVFSVYATFQLLGELAKAQPAIQKIVQDLSKRSR